MEDELLTTNDVMKILKISRNSVRGLRHSGELQAYRHPYQGSYGGPVYFKRSEVEKYIKNKLKPVKEA